MSLDREWIRGAAPLAVLTLLDTREMYGYELVQSVSAESEGVTPDRVIQRLVRETPSKEGELTSDPRLQKIFAA